jgi:hypothetical protein
MSLSSENDIGILSIRGLQSLNETNREDETPENVGAF